MFFSFSHTPSKSICFFHSFSCNMCTIHFRIHSVKSNTAFFVKKIPFFLKKIVFFLFFPLFLPFFRNSAIPTEKRKAIISDPFSVAVFDQKTIRVTKTSAPSIRRSLPPLYHPVIVRDPAGTDFRRMTETDRNGSVILLPPAETDRTIRCRDFSGQGT